MSNLDQQTFRDIVNLLIPHCGDPASRKSLATTALFGCKVLDRIEYSGNPQDYVIHLVTTLLTYGECEVGKPSLIGLLEEVKGQVGISQQEKISDLISSIPVGTIAENLVENLKVPSSTGEHVFISYSRDNLANVRRITTDLLNAGINVWIDQTGLKAGTVDWEQALRDAIDGAFAVLFMASPIARRSAYVRDELAIAQAKNKPIYPVWVAGEERTDCIPMGLGYVQLVDIRGDAYAAGLQQLVEGLVFSDAIEQPKPQVEADTSKPIRNPYKGLRSFRGEDAKDFFGRDSLIDDIIKTLDKGIEPPRLLSVLGASGSGKSSLIMAGLLPLLETGAIEGSENWCYLEPIVPGRNPIESLTITLARSLKDKSHKTIREDLYDKNKRGLHVLSQELSDKPVILYVDQFEELFTLVHSEEERRQFIDLLTTAITEPSGKLVVILTMRADFYDRPAQYKELGDLIQANHVLVTPMSLADLYDVVQKPAHQVGLIFEEGLETEIVFAVRNQTAVLPLLQFALDQLFENREGNALTHTAYKDMGGVQGALAQHAESTFNKLPSDKHREMAYNLFLRLIQPGATEQDTTRRRATYNELELESEEETHILQETADALVDARLLVTDKSGDERTIEVSHEALIRSWKRLANWIVEAKDDLHLQDMVRRAAYDWDQNDRDPDYLWSASRLADVNEMVKRRGWQVDETVRAFIMSEAERWLTELRKDETPVQRRLEIGLQLAVLPDPRPGVGVMPSHIPDIQWVEVDAGGQQFYISQYLVTVQQFMAFLRDSNGFDSDQWWEGLVRPQTRPEPSRNFPNYPMNNITWDEAVAYCRWVSAKTNQDIRLPTVAEWQALQALFNRNKAENEICGNTWESGLADIVAVGLFPSDVTDLPLYDCQGNVRQWGMDDVSSGQYNRTGPPSDKLRPLLGESWGRLAHATPSIISADPQLSDIEWGLRLALGALPHIPFEEQPRTARADTMNTGPISQEVEPYRARLPVWIKMLPTLRFQQYNEDFQLIDRNDLKRRLADKRTDITDKVIGDLDFMDVELLRLFRGRDYQAAFQQNRYNLYEFFGVLLIILLVIMASFTLWLTGSNPRFAPFMGFAATILALLSIFLVTIKRRTSPYSAYMENRRVAEFLRREYFRFLISLPPYHKLKDYEKKRMFSIRAANINRGIDERVSQQATEGQPQYLYFDRETDEAYYDLFDRYMLQDTQNYYNYITAQHEKALQQCNLGNASCLLISSLMIAASAFSVAQISGETSQCATDLLCNILPALAPMLVLTALVFAGFAIFFAILPLLYQWERKNSIYVSASDNLNVAHALSPFEGMKDADYRLYLENYAEGALRVMENESTQFGLLIRTPQSYTN